jgi:hypothetical protein
MFPVQSSWIDLFVSYTVYDRLSFYSSLGVAVRMLPALVDQL